MCWTPFVAVTLSNLAFLSLQRKINSKIAAYIRIIEDQTRASKDSAAKGEGNSRSSNSDNTNRFFPASLEVYAPRALEEYKLFVSKYEDGPTPKLVPLYLIQEKKLPPNVVIATNPVLLSGAKATPTGD